MNLLIRNGRVIDPSQQIDEISDLLIEDGVITKRGRSIKAPASVQKLDATGLVVAPGFIDLHCHLREPGQEHKETIRSGTRAAVRGGFTAVCSMANTVPPNDERAVTEMVLAEAQRNGACRVYPIGAVSRGLAGEALAEMADLHAAGCVAFSDDGKPVRNAQLMRRALEYARMLDAVIVAHEEDADLTEGGVMHEGFVSTVLGLRGNPAASEETMVARDVILAELTGGRLHIAHASARGALAAVRRAKAEGLRVTCEVTPHHIALTDEELKGFSTNFKMNPPLRSSQHRDSVIEGILDGTVDAIATDHAPHHKDEKNVEFDLAPFGITGLETAFSVTHDRLVASGLMGLDRLIDLLSSGPARVFSLPGGTLRSGAIGDVTVIDPKAAFVAGNFVSLASNTPFGGMTFRGKVIATIVGGEIRFFEPSTDEAKPPARSRERAKRR